MLNDSIYMFRNIRQINSYYANMNDNSLLNCCLPEHHVEERDETSQSKQLLLISPSVQKVTKYAALELYGMIILESVLVRI